MIIYYKYLFTVIKIHAIITQIVKQGRILFEILVAILLKCKHAMSIKIIIKIFSFNIMTSKLHKIRNNNLI